MKALEHRLAAWQPAAGALDRDRMLYEAGRSAARADSHTQAWRLTAAALLLLLIGSGGLMARQRSLLAQQEYLLARERSQRSALETTLAAQIRSVPPEIGQRPGQPFPVGPFDPTSYFVLASHHSQGVAEPSWPDAGMPADEHRREAKPAVSLPTATPLRPRDLDRIFDL